MEIFETGFGSYTHDGDTIEATREGFRFVATVHHDSDMGAPWDEHDGHGPVSDWTRRDKQPGELELCESRGAKRFYDFQEACRIARREGWGIAPKGLKIEQAPNGLWNWISLDGYETGFPCQNSATRAAYDYLRSTMSPREYAARAARHDFEVLRAWCNDQWAWCGIAVQVFSSNGDELTGEYDFAVWGIDYNYPGSDNEYLRDVANEKAQEAWDSVVLPLLQSRATVQALQSAGV